MIYISDNTDLSKDYPDGFIFIPTKDDKVATRVWVLLTNDDTEDSDEWGCSVLCDSCKNPIVDARQNMRCINFSKKGYKRMPIRSFVQCIKR